MRNQFTLERHALERHQTYLREAAHDRLAHDALHQPASPVAPIGERKSDQTEKATILMTIRAALAGLAVLTLIFASPALTFVTHIYGETIVG
jgi:hypothetical protein